MATKLPIVFRQDKEPTIASYDYADVADGIGYVIYHLATNSASGAVVMTNELYSEATTTIGTGSSTGTWNKVKETDFDITYNLPRVVNGVLYCSFTHGLNVNTSAKSGESLNMVHIYHVDKASTETELISGQTTGLAITSGPGNWNSPSSETALVGLTVPQTSFKKDESLRVAV